MATCGVRATLLRAWLALANHVPACQSRFPLRAFNSSMSLASLYLALLLPQNKFTNTLLAHLPYLFIYVNTSGVQMGCRFEGD